MFKVENMKPKRQAITIQSAAEYMSCSRSYLYRKFESGEITGYKLGDRLGIRVYFDSLQEFVEKREAE
jgi:excisionase family DNA binding protein